MGSYRGTWDQSPRAGRRGAYLATSRSARRQQLEPRRLARHGRWGDPDVERARLGGHAHYACWRRQELPARWQYGTHPRVPAIVCQMDPGWDALWPGKVEWLQQHQPQQMRGSHGYDPDLPSMRASFIASGPAFRTQVTLPVFDNVDVYPLLMRLLRLPAEPNDGDITPLLPALQDSP